MRNKFIFIEVCTHFICIYGMVQIYFGPATLPVMHPLYVWRFKFSDWQTLSWSKLIVEMDQNLFRPMLCLLLADPVVMEHLLCQTLWKWVIKIKWTLVICGCSCHLHSACAFNNFYLPYVETSVITRNFKYVFQPSSKHIFLFNFPGKSWGLTLLTNMVFPMSLVQGHWSEASETHSSENSVGSDSGAL